MHSMKMQWLQLQHLACLTSEMSDMMWENLGEMLSKSYAKSQNTQVTNQMSA